MKRTSDHDHVVGVVDAMRIAFALQAVERVVRAVALEPAPRAAPCLLGTANVAGELVPVYDLRQLLGAPSRPPRAQDHMLLFRPPTRCGLLVDAVVGTAACERVELTCEFSLHAVGLRGVARTPSGALLVQDLRRLLALVRSIPVAAHA